MAGVITGKRRSTEGWRTKPDAPFVMKVRGTTLNTGGTVDPGTCLDRSRRAKRATAERIARKPKPLPVPNPEKRATRWTRAQKRAAKAVNTHNAS